MTAQMTAMPGSRRALLALVHALPWALVVILTALNLLYIVRMGINDDAYITYRVARNLANGLGPVFNPGERVLSITTPGYMLLLAASSLSNQDFETLALVWNGLALLALGGLLIDASRAGADQRPPALAALAAAVAVAVTLANPLLSAAVGMETPLYLAALLAVFASYRRAWAQPAASQRWLLAAAAAAAITFLLRPDGALVGLVVGVHWLVTRRRIPWAALALGLLLALPWVLFAWSYYGSPLPNTLAAKISQGLPDRAGQWGQQLWSVGREWVSANPLAALLAAVGAVLALRRTGAPATPGQRVRRLMLVWAVLYIGVHVALRVRGYYWYYVPLLPVLALLAGDGAAGVVRWLALQPGPAWRIARTLAVAVLLVGLFWPAAMAVRDLTAPEPPGQRQMAYERTGLLLRDLCQQPGHEPVGMTEIGMLGYISDCHVLDFSGLLQPEIAHLRLPVAEKITWAIKTHNPPLLVLAGSSGYPFVVTDQPWFRQRYEPVDIQNEDGFLSVIHRRTMGPSAQRELGARWWSESKDETANDPLVTTLVFPLGVTPAITLHTFLPVDSELAVAANGEPILTLDGAASTWQDAHLPDVRPLDGAVTLELTGHAADQPAAAAWVESNAAPSIQYFRPLVVAADQLRPNLQMELGDSVQATLAPPSTGPVVLDVAYRDLPGVQLVVVIDGQEIGVVGNVTDVWQVARFELPAGALTSKPTVDVELRNPVQQFVRVYYAALVDPARLPYKP
jgi:hypothetical protein